MGMVAPLAGAWIEIGRWAQAGMESIVAPLAGAWIEIHIPQPIPQRLNSRSPRGSVDWNLYYTTLYLSNENI